MLCRLIAKKYNLTPEQLNPNIEKLSAKELMELCEIILEWNSYEKVGTWIRQQQINETKEH